MPEAVAAACSVVDDVRDNDVDDDVRRQRRPTKLRGVNLRPYLDHINNFYCYHHRNWTLQQIQDSRVEREAIPFAELAFASKVQGIEEFKQTDLIVIHMECDLLKHNIQTLREELPFRDVVSYNDWTAAVLLKQRDRFMSAARQLGGDWPRRIDEAYEALFA